MRNRRAWARPASALAGSALAFAGPLGLGACRDATAPLPVAAIRFAPPPIYARWWALTEACSGRSSDFATYAWYVVPWHALGSAPGGHDGTYVAGYADPFGRRVVLDSAWQDDGGVVRHEMLHALLGPAYASGGPARVHPPAFFQGRCANVVDCPPLGCADAGPAPTRAPADAPALALAALDVHVELLPDRVTRVGAGWADRAFTVVLRATNPSAGPVWVPLDAVPGVAAPRVPQVGFQILPAQGPLVIPSLGFSRLDSAGVVYSDTTRRAAFAAGQTRWFVWDWTARPFAAGDYAVVGFLNARQVSTPLTVTP